jgi:hypothetical protein
MATCAVDVRVGSVSTALSKTMTYAWVAPTQTTSEEMIADLNPWMLTRRKILFQLNLLFCRLAGSQSTVPFVLRSAWSGRQARPPAEWRAGPRISCSLPLPHLGRCQVGSVASAASLRVCHSPRVTTAGILLLITTAGAAPGSLPMAALRRPQAFQWLVDQCL